MRLVLYLGTRSCRSVLADAVDGYHDALRLLVPADPQLLGPNLDGDEIVEGLADVAEIVRRHGLEHARGAAREQDQALTQVFGESPRATEERVDAKVLEGPLGEALPEAVSASSPEAVYVARDALDVLDDAGLRISGILDPYDVDLIAR